jgi:hypothetical protein
MGELWAEGKSTYAISTELNRRRFRAPRGGRWTDSTVRSALRRAGLYTPRPTPQTPPEARDLIERLAQEGVSIPKTIEELRAAGLSPAHGGQWHDTTVRRIRERARISTRRGSDAQRFQKSVKTDPRTGCELWEGPTQNGYGKFEVAGKHILAHRWSYESNHGPQGIPDGFHLHHVCRRPNCVNPAHLIPVAPTMHATLEAEEDRINEAVRSGQLVEELRERRAHPDTWPDWLADVQRVGSRRPKAL